jgi:hypothetical protein
MVLRPFDCDTYTEVVLHMFLIALGTLVPALRSILSILSFRSVQSLLSL